jgi:hypothetical protein
MQLSVAKPISGITSKPASLIYVLYVKVLPWILIALGFALRLDRLFHNATLTTDDCQVALNVLTRSPVELLRPLDMNQAAPYLFLLVTKLSVSLMGDQEIAFRLVASFSSVLTLVVGYQVTKSYVGRYAV